MMNDPPAVVSKPRLRLSLPSGARASASVEGKILLALVCVLLALALFVLRPLWPWILISLWTSQLLRPLVERAKLVGHRRERAAGLAVVGLLVAVAVPVCSLVVVLGIDAYQLATQLVRSPSGKAALLQLVSSDGSAEGKTFPIAWDRLLSFDLDMIGGLLRKYGGDAFGAVAVMARALGEMALGVLVYLTSTYAFLVHGRAAYRAFEAQVPMSPQRLRRLAEALLETGRGLLFSVALTGAVQATIATVAYFALGVPRAAALGFATFLASIIPAVGCALVWAPVSLGLFLSGHSIAAAVLASIGLVFISSVDNVLRPVFARWGRLRLNPILMLFAMLGGVLTLGPWGLVFGPLVIRMAIEAAALLREARPDLSTPAP